MKFCNLCGYNEHYCNCKKDTENTSKADSETKNNTVRCIACWFFDCRCKEGLSKKKI